MEKRKNKLKTEKNDSVLNYIDVKSKVESCKRPCYKAQCKTNRDTPTGSQKTGDREVQDLEIWK